MGFLENVISHPSPAYLELAHYIPLFASMILFPFTGLVLGASLLSVTLELADRQGNLPSFHGPAKDLMTVSFLKPTTAVTLCIVPLLAISLVDTALYHMTWKLEGNFWPAAFILAVSGSILLLLYRSSMESHARTTASAILFGGGGTLLLFLVYILMTGMTGLYMNPEMWPFAERPSNIFLTWNNCTRTAIYVFLALAASGAGTLQSPAGEMKKGNPDGSEILFSARIGRAISMLFVLLLPPLVIAYLVTLPVAARCLGTFILSGLSLLLITTTAFSLMNAFHHPARKRGRIVFFMVLLIFLSILLMDHVSRVNSTTERTALLLAKTEVRKATVTRPPPGEKPREANALLVEKGEKVFEKVCSACHRFDQRLVGPPYNEVVPKYRGRKDALMDFIRNPVKKNPDYPPMPKLGLKEEEIEAVATFLIEKTAEKQLED